MKRHVAALLLGVVSLLVAVAWPAIVAAQQSQSTNYSVDEVFFGTGGELEACSAGYCSKQAAGETAVGATNSTNYGAQAGFNTNREEYLSLYVDNTSTNLGILSAGTPATTTGTFSVSAYLASGYVISNGSDPPRSGPNFLNNLTSPTASVPNSEQFGINLVQNTVGCGAPANFGADPTQTPDNTFGFGSAASGYNTCGQFKYVKGDTIAAATRSSGITNYTVSYLYNISNATKSGEYVFNHTLVATATY